jgi:hypothetical protein
MQGTFELLVMFRSGGFLLILVVLQPMPLPSIQSSST